MIGIIMDGKCKECTVSYLELSGEVIGGRNVWKLKCTRKELCDYMEQRFKESGEDIKMEAET